MKQTKQQPKEHANILEKGYRPIGRLSTQHPPQGRSVVPSKPIMPVQNRNN